MYEDSIEEEELISCIDEIRNLPNNQNTIDVLGHIIVNSVYSSIRSYISDLNRGIRGVIFFIGKLVDPDDEEGLYINERYSILSRYIEAFNIVAKCYDEWSDKKPIWDSIECLTGKSIDDLWNDIWQEYNSKKNLSIHDVFAVANREYYYKEFEKTAKWVEYPED